MIAYIKDHVSFKLVILLLALFASNLSAENPPLEVCHIVWVDSGEDFPVGDTMTVTAVVNDPATWGPDRYEMLDDGGTGALVNLYTGEITNADLAGMVTVKAYAKYSKSTCFIETTLCVVGVERIDGPLEICVNEVAKYTAFPSPEGCEFPDGEPTWLAPGETPVSQAGLAAWEFKTKWATPGLKTVTATCGTSAKTIEVTVLKIDSITLTETKAPGFTLTTNAHTVTGLTSDFVYVFPNNNVELSYSAAVNSDKFLFKVIGSGATPQAGSFDGAGKVKITLPFGGTNALVYNFYVGCDANSNGVLDDDERSHSLTSKFVSLYAPVKAKRTSAPVEQLYKVNTNDHFEVGGTFLFDLEQTFVGSNGQTVVINWELWDSDGGDDLLAHGTGTSFSHTFVGGDQGDAYVRFFCDNNGNGDHDGDDEHFLESNYFRVQDMKTYTFRVKISDLAITTANQVQDKLDASAVIALRKDKEDDCRATIILKGVPMTPVPGFNAITEGLTDPVSGGVEEDAYWQHGSDGDLYIVSSIVGKKGLHQSDVLGNHVLMIDWNAAVPETWVHEFGHVAGLDHANSTMHIMHTGSTRASGANLLTHDEAHAYNDD